MKRTDDTDLLQVTPHVYANAAGLQWLEAHKKEMAADPRRADRCEMGPLWICPFVAEGYKFPCLRPQHYHKQLVKVGYVNWVEAQEPIGQMSLFMPTVTHRRVRRHWKSGKELPLDSEPRFVSVFCRRMVMAFIKHLEIKQGMKVPAWRIYPIKKPTKEHQAWVNEHVRSGIKPCVFEPDFPESKTPRQKREKKPPTAAKSLRKRTQEKPAQAALPGFEKT